LWLLTIAEALSHRGGNLLALWRFFVVDAAQEHTFAEAWSSWSYGLTGVLQQGFGLAWGGHFPATHPWWTTPVAVGQIIALLVAGRRDLKAGRTFEGALAAGSFIVCASALWSLTRIRGDIVDHQIFWLALFGAVNLGIGAAAALRWIAEARGIRWAGDTRAWAAALAVTLTAAVGLGVRDLRDFTSFESRRSERTPVLGAEESIRRYVRDRNVRRLLVRIDDSVWSLAAGVLLRLHQEETPFSVTPEWIPMFTRSFAANGLEDAVVTIGRQGRRPLTDGRPAAVLLFEGGSIYVEAAPIDPLGSR
jgi:hypothetical protein